MIETTKLKKRILEISYKHKLSHIGSCLSVVEALRSAYDQAKEDDVVILSCGHAGLAQYCALEQKYNIDPEMLLEKHGIHPGKDLENKIFCTTGHLGAGIGIAIGYALANRNRDVYCIISDGEAYEGLVYEALNVARMQKLDNLKVTLVLNGYGAYSEIDCRECACRLQVLFPVRSYIYYNEYSFLQGQDAHYHVMTSNDYYSTDPYEKRI